MYERFSFNGNIDAYIGCSPWIPCKFVYYDHTTSFGKKGKLNIFYRFSYQKGMNGETWGFEETPNGGKCFVIPIVFEFQNTSNTTRVIRDVSMHLYDGKNL